MAPRGGWVQSGEIGQHTRVVSLAPGKIRFSNVFGGIKTQWRSAVVDQARLPESHWTMKPKHAGRVKASRFSARMPLG